MFMFEDKILHTSQIFDYNKLSSFFLVVMFEYREKYIDTLASKLPSISYLWDGCKGLGLKNLAISFCPSHFFHTILTMCILQILSFFTTFYHHVSRLSFIIDFHRKNFGHCEMFHGFSLALFHS